MGGITDGVSVPHKHIDTCTMRHVKIVNNRSIGSLRVRISFDASEPKKVTGK